MKRRELFKTLGQRGDRPFHYPVHLTVGMWGGVTDSLFVTCHVCGRSGGIKKPTRPVLARFLRHHRRCGFTGGHSNVVPFARRRP